jgi:hypothetical protein
MAFEDDPIVDDNSKNSEESVHYVKGLFSKKNGFICRTDLPDFGVDELVELVKFNQDTHNFDRATNKRFVLQLKSLEKISENNILRESDKGFIKLSFKTSRLSYLLQYTPAYGLVIIYDVSSSRAYFDYAENIYKNLNEFHDGERWKRKETPTIYIPLENELNSQSLSIIHHFFTSRHENADCLIFNHGEAYNIPSFKKPSSQEFDFKNSSDIIKALKKHGWALVDDNDLVFLDSMMKQLSHQDILNDSNLCLLKATVSCEIGDHLDADYFLFKYDRLENVSDTESPRKIFLRNKINFILGRVDSKLFIVNLQNLKENIHDDYNKILIDINIFFIEFLQKISAGIPNSNRFEDLMILFEKIDSSRIQERKKHYLNTYHISNLVIFVTDYIREKFSSFKIKESMEIGVPLTERELEVKDLISKVTILKNMIFTTWTYGSKIDDNYLIANSMYNLANYEFVFYYNIALLNWDSKTETISDRENYTRFINLAFSSFDLFNKMGKIHNAYLSLILAHELTLLFKILNKETILNEPELIEKDINNIQIKMGYRPFKSAVKSSEANLLFNKRQHFNTFQEIDESDIDALADILCKSLSLPEDRKKHIKADILTTKCFYKNRPSADFELFQNLLHTKNASTLYKFPVMYAIHCKKCNSVTPFNPDIEVLLSLLNNHLC